MEAVEDLLVLGLDEDKRALRAPQLLVGQRGRRGHDHKSIYYSCNGNVTMASAAAAVSMSPFITTYSIACHAMGAANFFPAEMCHRYKLRGDLLLLLLRFRRVSAWHNSSAAAAIAIAAGQQPCS